MTTDTNYALLLNTLRKVESKYGSITKAPSSDPDYRVIRKLYPNKSVSETTDQQQNKITKYVEQGYPLSVISNRVGLSNSDVSNYIKIHHLQLKKTFTYKVKAPNNAVYFTANLTSFIKGLFGHYAGRKSNTEYLTMRHFKVTKGYYLWKQIPNGSYYYLNYLDHPAMKNGQDSYIFPSAITNS